jgi:hypothetical protein
VTGLLGDLAESAKGPKARIWDPYCSLLFTLDGVEVDAPSPSRRLVTLPIAHPVAKWALELGNRPSGAAFLTVDGEYPDRWLGPLKEFRTARGAAHTCPTCNQDSAGTVLQLIWELPSFAPGWWPWIRR